MRKDRINMTRWRKRVDGMPRTTTINISVSPEEKELIKQAAAARGISMGAYLIGLALPDGVETRVSV